MAITDDPNLPVIMEGAKCSGLSTEFPPPQPQLFDEIKEAVRYWVLAGAEHLKAVTNFEKYWV
jgi:hypothetical protein